MSRLFEIFGVASVLVLPATSGSADEIRGNYLEARTCQVYTGPCFANGEVGLTGKHAIMSWNIKQGKHEGIDLTGLSVAVVVSASHTLGFAGLSDAKQLKSVVYVDENATPQQHHALLQFVRSHAGKAADNIVEVRSAPIEMELNYAKLTGNLQVGKLVTLKTRKARPQDCICSNESAYYPPLVELAGFVPGVTIEGDVSARALGSRWSIPDSRTAYLGRFHYE